MNLFKNYRDNNQHFRGSKNSTKFFTRRKKAFEIQLKFPEIPHELSYFSSQSLQKSRFVRVNRQNRVKSQGTFSSQHNTSKNSSLRKSTSQKAHNISQITPNESFEIKSTIKSRIDEEYSKAQNRLSRRIKIMNKIGIIPQKANEVRGKSLLSVESSLIEKSIPRLKKIVTSEVLLKRDKEKLEISIGTKDKVLSKIEKLLTKNYSPLFVFSNLKSSDDIQKYIDTSMKKLQKYSVTPIS